MPPLSTRSILIIKPHLDGGGIETMIARLSMYWARSSSPLCLFVLSSLTPRLKASIDPHTPCFLGIKSLCQLSFWTRLIQVRAVFITDLKSLLLVSLLYPFLRLNRTRILVGFYHPHELSYPFSILKGAVRHLLRQIPPTQIIFMNILTRNSCSSAIDIDFVMSPILPIPVESVGMATLSSVSKRIISIGRLVNFKPYPFAIIDTLKSLSDLGINDLSYHVYGEGECLDALSTYIVDKGMSDRVFLHGYLPYSHMVSVLEDAFMFIGMGTSLVEAAACRIPSVIAIISERSPISYGFFGMTSPQYQYCFGERMESESTYLYSDLILSLLNGSVDRKVVIDSGFKEAQKYSLSSFSDLFFSLVDHATYVKRPFLFWGMGIFTFLILIVIECVPSWRKKRQARYA